MNSSPTLQAAPKKKTPAGEKKPKATKPKKPATEKKAKVRVQQQQQPSCVCLSTAFMPYLARSHGAAPRTDSLCLPTADPKVKKTTAIKKAAPKPQAAAKPKSAAKKPAAKKA